MGETRRRRYRWLENEFAPKGRQRVMVVVHRGWEGHVVRSTASCTGCTEFGDCGSLLLGDVDEGGSYRGVGCEECGYTGKRRRADWLPFDVPAYSAHRDRVWARYQRFCRHVRRATPAEPPR